MKTDGWICLAQRQDDQEGPYYSYWIYRKDLFNWGDCMLRPTQKGFNVALDFAFNGKVFKERYSFESMAQADLCHEALLQEYDPNRLELYTKEVIL